MPEEARVPDRVRVQLEQPARAVARELRETADRVSELNPPEEAEEELDSLVAAAGEQADRLDELREQEGLTVRELADAVEPPIEELRRLRAAGIQVQPPPAESGG